MQEDRKESIEVVLSLIQKILVEYNLSLGVKGKKLVVQDNNDNRIYNVNFLNKEEY